MGLGLFAGNVGTVLVGFFFKPFYLLAKLFNVFLVGLGRGAKRAESDKRQETNNK